MSKKKPARPERTQKRDREREVKQLVRDREKLAAHARGASLDKAIEVSSAAQIEIRVNAQRCPQCDGDYKIVDHRSSGQGGRPVDVKCNVCGMPRTIWFQIVEPN
ncbi:MAG TPA: MJ0042-type zinc finger domain-containing protein [Kofleriaceae bacterium]|nr:MJ0042-type zinc finger domain-containing protein [Kofleriaceae bacterium]